MPLSASLRKRIKRAGHCVMTEPPPLGGTSCRWWAGSQHSQGGDDDRRHLPDVSPALLPQDPQAEGKAARRMNPKPTPERRVCYGEEIRQHVQSPPCPETQEAAQHR